MSITRRNFLTATGAATLVSGKSVEAKPVSKPVVNPIAEAAKKPTPQIPPLKVIPGPPCLQAGPMLGHVQHDRAWIWVQASKETKWRVEISDHADFENSTSWEGGNIDAISAFTSAVEVTGLKPKTEYYYRIWFGDREVTSIPLASFTTPDLAKTAGKIRVAFSSCVGRLPEDSSAAFGEMADRANFDLLLMLGDNHYGDTTDLERQRLYYTAHRKITGYRDLGAKRPIYAIWDDHDFGPNNSDSTAEGKENSLQAFREYWRNTPRVEEAEDPAIYFKFERAGVEFFMLDVRWHRSPNRATDGPEKTMLGQKQLEWLKRSLKQSTAKIKLLASGSEWQTKGHADSWTSFEQERRLIWDWLEKEKIPGVIFLSGDRHFSAGYHIRNLWPEFTAGPLGSPNERNAKAVVTTESFTLRYDGKMWMILEIDTSPEVASVTYEIWEAGEGLIESGKLPDEVVLSQRLELPRSELVKEILSLRNSS